MFTCILVMEQFLIRIMDYIHSIIRIKVWIIIRIMDFNPDYNRDYSLDYNPDYGL